MRSMKMNENDNAKYYEESNFGELIKSAKNKRIVGKKIKRITMNISEEIFNEAHILDKFMNMGYQNVLKTAITLGINQLQQTISEQKHVIKSLAKH